MMKDNSYFSGMKRSAVLLAPTLKAMAALLLQFKIRHYDISEWKLWQQAFVEASEDALLSDGRHSKTDIALHAGVPRKLLNDLPRRQKQARPKYASAVIDTWLNHADYQDAQGRPKALDVKDGPHSLRGLCRAVCGEVGYTNAIEDLVKAGAVEIHEDIAELKVESLISTGPGETTLYLVREALKHLLQAITHNLKHPRQTYIQRLAWSEEIPAEHAEAVAQKLREIQEKANLASAQVLREAEKLGDASSRRCTVAAGVYVNVEEHHDE